MQGLTLQPSWHIYLPGGYRVSVEQWRSQFRQWTNIKEDQISRFTSECKENVRRCATPPLGVALRLSDPVPSRPSGVSGRWSAVEEPQLLGGDHDHDVHDGGALGPAVVRSAANDGLSHGHRVGPRPPRRGPRRPRQRYRSLVLEAGHRCCWLVVTRGRGRAGTVSATVFRKVVTTVPAHCKMGLTGMRP